MFLFKRLVLQHVCRAVRLWSNVNSFRNARCFGRFNVVHFQCCGNDVVMSARKNTSIDRQMITGSLALGLFALSTPEPDERQVQTVQYGRSVGTLSLIHI